MTIVYFSNFINHHQKLVADELYELTGHQYTFVEATPMYDWLKKGGYTDYSHLPYVLRAWENDENRQKAIELAKTADVALFGGPEVLDLEVIRARHTDKLSFEVSERWLKKGWVNLLSPRLLKNQWYYHTLFKKKPFYKLCASAFGARDQHKLHSFINRCYKWGYFTKVEPLDVDKLEYDSDVVKIMWCARFLDWKHPELPVLLADNLKKQGYKFTIDMYGSGEMFECTNALAQELNVTDVVNFCGNVPNEQILKAMREHEVFLFTSDQNEGWGAVANEAMSNGCVLVGSDKIGSVPFLVEDGKNGFQFRSANKNTGFKRKLVVDHDALKSLVSRVEWLLSHRDESRLLAIEAYKTMSTIWSPKNASKNLVCLINDLQHGKETSQLTGPCSKAKIL